LQGAPAATAPGSSVASYELPGDKLFPESIAYDPSTRDFYVGGLLDGVILRGNATSPAAVTVVSPAGAGGRVSAAGVKVDGRRRLWVAGAESGKIFVYRLPDVSPIAALSVGHGDKRVVNDVAIAEDGEAYVTDSSFPALYHVVPGQEGKLSVEEFPVDPAVVPYTGAYNLNGLVVTPDQRALILVQTSTGKLFRMERSTHAFAPVDLHGAALHAGDGLAIAGRTIFAACNATRSIARVSMADDFRSGTVVSNSPIPSLAFPTALVIDGDAALVVNSQIDALGSGKRPSPPFTVTRYPLSDIR
jgi:Cu-Zn family superoxide dismutase